MQVDPRTTALVVIDLDEATVSNDDVSQRMTQTVNSLATAVRQNGGVVAWVLSRMSTMPRISPRSLDLIWRRGTSIGVEDPHQPIRMRVRQPLQDYAIDERKEQRAGADAGTDRDDRQQA